jgi:hypothetical protein
MKKHVLTFKSVKYALSEDQYQMLLKSTVKAKETLTWQAEQRMDGFLRKGLFRKENGNYKRTILGNELLKEFKLRDKARAKAAQEVA